MSHLTYTIYPGVYGETMQEQMHFSQAVRIGDIVELSGQGGWDRETLKVSLDIPTQIAKAFENVEVALHAAGVSDGWKAVYSIKTFFAPISEEVNNAVITQLKRYCPGHRPIWTAVGVAKLGLEDLRMGIDVRAHAPLVKEGGK